jgi:hypothetical protein
MLPELMRMDGEWDSYEERIYDCFCSTLVDNAPYFRAKRVSCQYDPSSKGKHHCFWHCISEGDVEEDRTPDLRRCERVGWIAWMIENSDTCEEVCVIHQKRGRNDRVVILHKEERFAVVLNEGRRNCALVTAFCVAGRRFEKLIQEYEAQKD